jgi:transcriptional regulator NrdR family protein
MVTFSITKRDGTKEPFNADKINRSIERAAAGLSDPISMVTQIATETRLTLYDGITTEEMDSRPSTPPYKTSKKTSSTTKSRQRSF